MVYMSLYLYSCPGLHKCQKKACFYICSVSIPVCQWSTCRCFQLAFAISQISHRCLLSLRSQLNHLHSAPHPFTFYPLLSFILFLFLYLPDIILFTYLLPCLFSVLPPPPHSYPLDVSSTETGIDSKHCVHHCLLRLQNST